MTSALSPHDPASAVILALGTSVPQFQVDCLTSADFAARTSMADALQSRKVQALYRRTGIDQRGSVLLDEAPGCVLVNDFYPPALSPHDRGPSTRSRSDRYATEAPILARQASAIALQRSGLAADEITHLVTVTCTGFTAPGIDIELIDQLGLPETTERIQVGFMGCHGAVNGLRAARGLLAVEEHARVLVCSVELCSLHYQYGLDADRVVSNALFADGSAALVMAPGRAGVSALGVVQATGSCLVPDSRDSMTWRIGDHGYEMTLSAQVPGLIERYLGSFLATWLARHGETINSIGGWAVHPGGTRILASTEAALGLGADALAVSRAVLADHGNMSSATMLFILDRFVQLAQPKPWLMLGFGPGLEIEVALLR
jgi:predicted naringenin-chalcone synthase